MIPAVGPRPEAVPRPQEVFPSNAQCQSLCRPWQSPRTDSGLDWTSGIQSKLCYRHSCERTALLTTASTKHRLKITNSVRLFPLTVADTFKENDINLPFGSVSELLQADTTKDRRESLNQC